MKEIRESIRHTLSVERDSIDALMDSLDYAQVEKIVEALVHCQGKVVVSGCGTSGVAAKKITHTLTCVDCPAVFLSPADAVHGAMGVLRGEDILILVSKGGNTEELTKLVPACKAKGARLVAITENPDSVLAQSCDDLLRVKVDHEPDAFNMLATASTLAVIAAMDAVAICVMERNGFSREKFAVIHPGGAVGHRLLGKR